MVLRRLRRPRAELSLAGLDAHEIKSRLLREADIFRHLAPSEMKEIERMTTMTTCPKGRVLFTPDTQAEVLFILKKGRVHTYRLTADGRRLVTAVYEAGTVFGEMPLLSQRLQGNTAETLDDSIICVVSRGDLEHLIQTKPHVALNIVHLLADRIGELEERLEMQTFQSVPERLASVLLQMADGGTTITAVSHQQIAETIGASRETVTRALGEFKAQGIIDIARARIIVKDVAALSAIAGKD